MPDHISPSYASGTFSVISDGGVLAKVNDYYNRNNTITGSTVAGGYVNVVDNKEVGSFNSDQNNIILSKVPVNQFTQQS